MFATRDSAPLIWYRDFSEFTFGGNLSGGLRAAIITSARSEQKCCRDCCQAGAIPRLFGMIDPRIIE